MSSSDNTSRAYGFWIHIAVNVRRCHVCIGGIAMLYNTFSAYKTERKSILDDEWIVEKWSER